MSIEATVRTTRQVLEQNLSIPFYQRPYRWTTDNVLQLLEDIRQSKAEGKLEYWNTELARPSFIVPQTVNLKLWMVSNG